MQRVIEIKNLSFLPSTPSIAKLNQEISQLNEQGYKVVSVTPNLNLFGVIRSYTLLVEWDK